MVLNHVIYLSGEFSPSQAKPELVKMQNLYFSYWAFSHIPVLSWAIRYSVFQPVKFSSSFEFVCRTIFSNFWHLVVKFGYNKWFLSNKKMAFSVSMNYWWNKKIIISIISKKNFWLFFWIRNVISNKRKLEKKKFKKLK